MRTVHAMPFALLALFMCAASAEAKEGPKLYARVVVDSTPLRTGPGARYRVAYIGHRGDVFLLLERGPQDYWFRVELPDSTSAWILGAAVYNHELGEEEASRGRFLPWLFAPAPIMQAHGEIALSFGVLGNNGLLSLRPTYFVQPTFGVELTGAATVGQGGRLFLMGAGGVINLFPEFPIVPFLVVGGGVALSDPNADTFLLRSGSNGMLYAGGGFRISFRYRITLRIEGRAYAFFKPDTYVAKEEWSGGLTVFF